MTDLSHRLHEETKAADVLRAQLAEIAGDDETLIRDTIEGDTSLRDLISLVAEQIVADDGLVDGLAVAVKRLADRKARIEHRISMTRVAIMAAMESAGIKSLDTPAGKLTVKATPPAALIFDEAIVPADYWKPQDPKLDKKAVLAALKEGREVPGAQLSNGGQTLQIRS